VVEQRYQAVLAVISDGETVTDVAARFGVWRQSVHEWLARYKVGGLDGLATRSHRPRLCPRQVDSVAEMMVLELRRSHPSWGGGGCAAGHPDRAGRVGPHGVRPHVHLVTGCGSRPRRLTPPGYDACLALCWIRPSLTVMQ
jgi:hypothetical protein